MDIDVERVAEVAVELEKCAVALSDVADAVATLAFGASGSGRLYADIGSRIAASYDGVESVFRQWSEASKDNTVRLRASIGSYRSADDSTALSLNQSYSR